MRYSACVEMLFTEYEFAERIRKAKECGFEYFEFWTWKDKNLPCIKEAMEKSNIKVASFSGDDEFSMVNREENAEYVKFVEKSIEVAKLLDCSYLVIHSNALEKDGSAKEVHGVASKEAMLINMYEVLKQLKPIAERERICLVLEPLNSIVDHKNYFLDTPEEAFELIKAVDSKYIKVLYDIYHMQIMRGNIIDTITKNIDNIGYIHVADVPRRHEPGTGELAFNNIFKAVKDCGYQGIIGFELCPVDCSRTAIDKIMEVIQRR